MGKELQKKKKNHQINLRGEDITWASTFPNRNSRKSHLQTTELLSKQEGQMRKQGQRGSVTNPSPNAVAMTQTEGPDDHSAPVSAAYKNVWGCDPEAFRHNEEVAGCRNTTAHRWIASELMDLNTTPQRPDWTYDWCTSPLRREGKGQKDDFGFLRTH